jgi:hypothetical protein
MPPAVKYDRTCALYVPAVVAVVFDVPVPDTLPVQSRPVAPVGTLAEKVMAVPTHFGPSCVGAAGTLGRAVMVAAVAVEYAL